MLDVNSMKIGDRLLLGSFFENGGDECSSLLITKADRDNTFVSDGIIGFARSPQMAEEFAIETVKNIVGCLSDDIFCGDVTLLDQRDLSLPVFSRKKLGYRGKRSGTIAYTFSVEDKKFYQYWFKDHANRAEKCYLDNAGNFRYTTRELNKGVRIKVQLKNVLVDTCQCVPYIQFLQSPYVRRNGAYYLKTYSTQWEFDLQEIDIINFLGSA